MTTRPVARTLRRHSGRIDRAATRSSNWFLANEIDELRRMSMMVPSIFLGVAAFLLNIVLTRLIATQREQIAALKALGYSKREIGTHYFGFVLLITTLALVVGTVGGAFMGRGMTALYVEFFSFPDFAYRLHPRVVVISASDHPRGGDRRRSLRRAHRDDAAAGGSDASPGAAVVPSHRARTPRRSSPRAAERAHDAAPARAPPRQARASRSSAWRSPPRFSSSATTPKMR